jgi:RNA polymerase sigma-70 factor (ECF subfamily)
MTPCGDTCDQQQFQSCNARHRPQNDNGMTHDTKNRPESAESVIGIDPQALSALHQEMLRFARLQLRDIDLAEDVVQESIAAALKSNNFAERVKLKTWVFAILRNKIIDVIRERTRHPVNSFNEDDTDDLDQPFKHNGHWQKDQQPCTWNNPEAHFENAQFWIIFEACLDHLPENPARVFMMREHLGLEVNQICSNLNISESNCWVLLHRARMKLRQCLEKEFMIPG